MSFPIARALLISALALTAACGDDDSPTNTSQNPATASDDAGTPARDASACAAHEVFTCVSLQHAGPTAVCRCQPVK